MRNSRADIIVQMSVKMVVLVSLVVASTACTSQPTTGPGPLTTGTTMPKYTGSPAPAEFVIHIERPSDMGDANARRVMSDKALKEACQNHGGPALPSYRMSQLSQDGVTITVECGDTTRHDVRVIFD
jgi:hypothetical protein